MTAEKQAPSALDLVGAMRQAVSLEKRQAAHKPGSSKALKDLLGKSISDYNKLTSNKRHRVDTKRKDLIYNVNLVYERIWGLQVVVMYKMAAPIQNLCVANAKDESTRRTWDYSPCPLRHVQTRSVRHWFPMLFFFSRPNILA